MQDSCCHPFRRCGQPHVKANLPTNIVGFRGLDSSIILSLRGGSPRPIGYLPESLSQAISAGIILVGRLGVKQTPRSVARDVPVQTPSSANRARSALSSRSPGPPAACPWASYPSSAASPPWS